jgi:branched-chain amino acid transport system permease protein
VNVLLNGLSLGMIIAAFALALVLIFRSTRIINFAQGSMAMFTTYIALEIVTAGYSYWLAFAGALLAGFVLGGVIERVVIRPVVGKPELNAVIVTLGLFVAIQALAAIMFGSSFRSFPSPVGLSGFQVGTFNLALTPTGLLTFGAVLLVLVGIVALFRFTNLGLTMRAAAFDNEVPRLLGVRVSRLLTFGWALAGLVGAVSGMLIATGSLVSPGYMEPIIVLGFVAAVIGGLDSPVVGGLLRGVVLSAVSGYLAPELVNISALVLLIVVLLLKPSGLFSSAVARRV